MRWLAFMAVLLVVAGLYSALVNRPFLRCPYCGKRGSWRFDASGEPIEVYDEDGHLVQTTQRQRCRQCAREVEQVWSDHTGRAIRRTED